MFNIDKCTQIPAAIPTKPANEPNKIYANLIILKWKLREKSGIEKEHIPVKDTIIIRIGLTMLASTAACHNINAPTIPMVCPTGEGTLILASLISSKDNSIISISNRIGNGTVSLAEIIVYNNSVGIIS